MTDARDPHDAATDNGMDEDDFDRDTYKWLTIDAIDPELPAGCRMAVHCIAGRTGALTLLAFQDTGPGSLGADLTAQMRVVEDTAGHIGGWIEQLREADFTPEIIAALTGALRDAWRDKNMPFAVLEVYGTRDGVPVT